MVSAGRFQRRQHLHADALIAALRDVFAEILDPLDHNSPITLTDALLSGFALFSLKDPSLLAFANRRHDDNLKAIYLIENVPCDTHLRTQLDDVDPALLAPAFTTLFAKLQRGKVLETYRFLDDSYLLLLDGVEYFRSQSIHCDKCLECHHRDGTVSYYHQMVGAVIAHPDHAEVLPLMPEPIQPQDGAKKGDCERTASKRLLERIAKEHPNLRFIVTADALSANGPHITLIKELGWHYILVAKPNDHEELYRQVDTRVADQEIEPYCFRDARTGLLHCFRWVNHVSLNKTHADLMVNFLEYWEVGPELDLRYYNSWVTDFVCKRGNVWDIMRGGRARWKVENETYNTLKNQGYHFEHNFGHGEKNLAVVFALLMMLAFAVDQIQQLTNELFQAAWEKCGSKRELWERIRSVVRDFLVSSLWEVYEVVYRGHLKVPAVLLEDTS